MPPRPPRSSLTPLGARARAALGELRAEGLEEEHARAWVFAVLAPSLLRASGRDVPADPREAASGWHLQDLPALPAARVEVLARSLAAARSAGAPADVSAALLRAHAEVLGASEARARAGAFYTPAPIVEGLLALVLPPLLARPPEALARLRVCDPSCGGGAFLLAALRRLGAAWARSSAAPEARCRAEVARAGVHGVDLDPVALALARGLVWGETDLPWGALPELGGFRCADALTGRAPGGAEAPAAAGSLREAWGALYPEVFAGGGFDAVVGNPPFHTPLQARHARDAASRARLRERFGGAIRGQADAAVAFALLGAELLAPGGRAGLLAPLSLLSTQDAAPARAAMLRRTALSALWIAREAVFPDASVRVCAPILQAPSGPGALPPPSAPLRYLDGAFTPIPARELSPEEVSSGEGWSKLAADVFGAPAIVVRGRGSLEGEALVRADFRDVYYGLGALVGEAPEGPLPEGRAPLVTTGLVDLAALRWGDTPTRFRGRLWRAPVVDLQGLSEGPLARWAPLLRAPKVLLATQTRVLEAVVDARGAWIPCTPLISILPLDPARLWHLAAAIAAPPIVALAAERTAGAGMSLTAIKLSVGQVRALPLPSDAVAWNEAAACFRAAQLEPAERARHLLVWASLACRAYGRSAAEARTLVEWWTARGAPRSPAPPEHARAADEARGSS